MDILITDKIFNLLLIAITFSTILMALVQKIKAIPFVKNDFHILVVTFLLSFLGIFFGMNFYKLSLADGIWVSLFSFIGAPTIYEMFKKQNVINCKPKSLEQCKDCLKSEKENDIQKVNGGD